MNDGHGFLAYNFLLLASREMKDDHDSDQYPPAETARRRDEAIRRALNTPPTPQKEMVGKVGAPNRGRPKRRSSPADKGQDQAQVAALPLPFTQTPVPLH
jgi:hypothetical protein